MRIEKIKKKICLINIDKMQQVLSSDSIQSNDSFRFTFQMERLHLISLDCICNPQIHTNFIANLVCI